MNTQCGSDNATTHFRQLIAHGLAAKHVLEQLAEVLHEHTPLFGSVQLAETVSKLPDALG